MMGDDSEEDLYCGYSSTPLMQQISNCCHKLDQTTTIFDILQFRLQNPCLPVSFECDKHWYCALYMVTVSRLMVSMAEDVKDFSSSVKCVI